MSTQKPIKLGLLNNLGLTQKNGFKPKNTKPKTLWVRLFKKTHVRSTLALKNLGLT